MLKIYFIVAHIYSHRWKEYTSTVSMSHLVILNRGGTKWESSNATRKGVFLLPWKLEVKDLLQCLLWYSCMHDRDMMNTVCQGTMLWQIKTYQLHCFLPFFSRTQDMTLELKDGDNEDLIKKNKKRKPLGSVQVKLTLTPMTKQEMNEVLNKVDFKSRENHSVYTYLAVTYDYI